MQGIQKIVDPSSVYMIGHVLLRMELSELPPVFLVLSVSMQEMFFKGSPDPSHLIFEIIVGKSRIRNITSLNLNDIIVNRFKSL